MPAQQETENPPPTRLAALHASYKFPYPRRYGLAAGLALIPFVTGFIGLVVHAWEGGPRWPQYFVIAAQVLVLIHIVAVAVEKPWARVVSLVAMPLAVLLWVITFWGKLLGSDAPLWVPLCLFGGLALVFGATVAGMRIRYLSVRWGEAS